MTINAEVIPLYDMLLVRVLKRGDRTSGGLIVPDMAQENTPFLTAEVIASGKGHRNFDGSISPLAVNDGDVVVFVRTSETRGGQIIYPLADGTEAMIISERHCALIVRDLPKSTGLLDLDGKVMVGS